MDDREIRMRAEDWLISRIGLGFDSVDAYEAGWRAGHEFGWSAGWLGGLREAQEIVGKPPPNEPGSIFSGETQRGKFVESVPPPGDREEARDAAG